MGLGDDGLGLQALKDYGRAGPVLDEEGPTPKGFDLGPKVGKEDVINETNGPCLLQRGESHKP